MEAVEDAKNRLFCVESSELRYDIIMTSEAWWRQRCSDVIGIFTSSPRNTMRTISTNHADISKGIWFCTCLSMKFMFSFREISCTLLEVDLRFVLYVSQCVRAHVFLSTKKRLKKIKKLKKSNSGIEFKCRALSCHLYLGRVKSRIEFIGKVYIYNSKKLKTINRKNWKVHILKIVWKL